ncbi:MAG: hypothetical protein SchgKO_10530 [Schleiferiaceae bacterium]
MSLILPIFILFLVISDRLKRKDENYTPLYTLSLSLLLGVGFLLFLYIGTRYEGESLAPMSTFILSLVVSVLAGFGLYRQRKTERGLDIERFLSDRISPNAYSRINSILSGIVLFLLVHIITIFWIRTASEDSSLQDFSFGWTLLSSMPEIEFVIILSIIFFLWGMSLKRMALGVFVGSVLKLLIWWVVLMVWHYMATGQFDFLFF